MAAFSAFLHFEFAFQIHEHRTRAAAIYGVNPVNAWPGKLGNCRGAMKLVWKIRITYKLLENDRIICIFCLSGDVVNLELHID